jgi:Kef-type K+ transport system membrane component KefB
MNTVTLQSSGLPAEPVSILVLWIALIWGISKVLNIVLDRFKLPAVLGELGTGLLFGVLLLMLPSDLWFARQLQYIRDSEVLHVLGELGIVLLLFEVGLETELEKIKEVGREAFLVALGGVITPFAFAWLLNSVLKLGWSMQIILFVGLVFAATSIGVTARVFQDLQFLKNINAKVVLGAAVLDDILGLVLLSVIVAFVQVGSASVGMIALIILKAGLFLVSAAWIGSKVSGKAISWLGGLGGAKPIGFLIWILTFCFLSAYLASLVGLAPIVGAFAAGIMLDRCTLDELLGEHKKIEDYTAPITAFLTPIFFAKVGLSLDLKGVWGCLPLALILIACISKLLSGYLFLPFKTQIDRLLVGVGMLPRGEVGLVVATIGRQIGLLDLELYSELLLAVIATTIIAPIWLQFLLQKKLLNIQAFIQNAPTHRPKK